MVDQGSYTHDFSKGSSPIWSGRGQKRYKFGINTSNDLREANKKWMRNVWGKAMTPMEYVTATTGTVYFTIANTINDITHIPYSRYKTKLTSGNFFGR